jgi:hypothetical protein
MVNTILALLFPVSLLISVSGYGALLHKAFFANKTQLNYLIPSLGISCILTAGGILNIFQSANGAQLVTIYIIGCLLAIVQFDFRRILRFKYVKFFSRAKISLFPFAVFIVFVYTYSLAIIDRNFNGSDDFEGYFVFASKFNQLGTMGNEYFSERRLVSSVGGQSFVDSIFLNFLPIEYLHASDLGFGFLALVVTVSLFLKARFWNKNEIGLLLLVICLINPMLANITSTYLLSLMIFSLLVFVTDKKTLFLNKDHTAVALIAVGGMTLKNSTTPFILGTVFLYSLLAIKKSRVTQMPIRGVFLVYPKILILWVPWGISLFLSCATFLYPVLGLGNHGSKYGTFTHNSDINSLEFLRALFGPIFYAPSYSIALVCVAIITGIGLIESRRSKRSLTIILFNIFMLVTLFVAITIGTSGFSNYRYIFPALLAFFLFMTQFLNKGKFIRLSIILLISLTLSIAQLSVNKWGYNSLISRFNPASISDSNLPNRESEIVKIQNSISDGSRVLLRTSFNFAFDFKRNNYQIADFPGAVSPPPGLPNFGTSEEMHSYLLSQEIDYVVFQYLNLFEKENNSGRIAEGANAWLKAEALNAFAFHDRMMEVSKIAEVVYDDGETFVLKMNKEKSP